MVQLVKPLTSSGHDLTVHGVEPCAGLCADSSELASDSVSLSLGSFPALVHMLSLSLSLSKINMKNLLKW